MKLNEDILSDFDVFLEFVAREKPKVTPTRRLGKKALYALNEKLSYTSDVDGPKYNQEKYPAIELLFNLSSQANLIYIKEGVKGKAVFVKKPVCEEYEELNSCEQYLYLLQTFWVYLDRIVKFGSWNSNYAIRILKEIAKGKPGQKIDKSNYNQYHMVFAEHAPFFYYLEFLGFGEVEKLPGKHFSYQDSISAFMPNQFGIAVSRFLTTKAVNLLNSNKTNEDAFEVFQALFPHEAEYTVSDFGIADSGVYTFKVSLGKRVWRKIAVAYYHTLEDLHLAIQNAFEFENDHLYAFFFGPKWTSTAIYCADANKPGPSTEETTIADMGLFPGQEMCYLFDFGDEWTFKVALLSIEDAPLPKSPEIIEISGQAPSQYS